MKKFITPFMIVITSITLSSCLEGSNPTKRRDVAADPTKRRDVAADPTKRRDVAYEYPPPHEGYVPKEDLVACLGNLCAKAESGLRKAKEGKFDTRLFMAKQARDLLMNKPPSHFFNSRKDYLNDRSKIEYIITEIEEMKKAAAEKKKKEREEKEKLDREKEEKEKLDREREKEEKRQERWEKEFKEKQLKIRNEKRKLKKEKEKKKLEKERKKKEREVKEKLDRELDEKKKSQESFLDDANEELNRLNFSNNNNDNKFDNVENPNEYIFQSPQTPSTPETPSMPETFSYPETYDYDGEF